MEDGKSSIGWLATGQIIFQLQLDSEMLRQQQCLSGPIRLFDGGRNPFRIDVHVTLTLMWYELILCLGSTLKAL